MGVITKVNYPKLAEIYSKKGKHEAVAYLKSIGVQAPYRAIKRMKENYMYDEELNKYIVPEDDKPSGAKRCRKKSIANSDNEDEFMSMEELCNKSTAISHEMGVCQVKCVNLLYFFGRSFLTAILLSKNQLIKWKFFTVTVSLI